MKRIDSLEQNIKSLNGLSEKVDKMTDRLDSRYNNVITSDGNYIAWASLLLATVGLVLGVVVIKGYFDSKKTKEDVEKTLTEIREKANSTLQKSSEVLAETKRNEAEMNTVITSLRSQEQKLKSDLTELQSEKENILNEIENIKKSSEKFIKDIDERFKIESEKTLELIDLYNQAYEKMNLGSIKIALQKFKKILTFNENHVGARCKLAMCYSSLDRDALAIDVISKYAHNENEHSAIYSTYGVILRRTGEYDKSLQYFFKALEGEFKNNHTTYSHIGYVYLFKRKYEKARESFNKSLELDENNSPSTYGLLKLSILENPDSDYSQLIELAHRNAERDINEHPKYPFPYFGLSFVEVLSNNPNYENSVKEAITLCKNIGILKEQLFEYKIFYPLRSKLKYIEHVCDILQKEIDRLSKLYMDVKQ